MNEKESRSFREMFPYMYNRDAKRYYDYSVRMYIKQTAFDLTCGWWKKLGPIGNFFYLFYWHLFMEGPKALPDGLSFDYFGDVLFWGEPVAEGPLAHLVGKRKV